jgi:hypothetical protein
VPVPTCNKERRERRRKKGETIRLVVEIIGAWWWRG